MITHLPNGEINKLKWDDCILRSVNALPYAFSWYLDCVAPGWEALVQGDYEAVMPLPCRKKYGVNYLFTPPFVQQLGVFGKGNVEEFIKAIPAKFSYIDLNFNEGNTIAESHKPVANANTLLSLNNTFEGLQKTFSDNTKRNAKKAVKAGLVFEELNTASTIITLFKENNAAAEKFSSADYTLLSKLIKTAQQHNAIEIFGVKNSDGKLCGGVVFFKTQSLPPGPSPKGEGGIRYVFLFSGSNAEAKQYGAMHFLISNFIELHAGENALLDFEGSNNKTLANFYLGFGGYSTSYQKLKINRLPLPLRLFKK